MAGRHNGSIAQVSSADNSFDLIGKFSFGCASVRWSRPRGSTASSLVGCIKGLDDLGADASTIRHLVSVATRPVADRRQ